MVAFSLWWKSRVDSGIELVASLISSIEYSYIKKTLSSEKKKAHKPSLQGNMRLRILETS